MVRTNLQKLTFSKAIQTLFNPNIALRVKVKNTNPAMAAPISAIAVVGRLSKGNSGWMKLNRTPKLKLIR